MIPFLIIITLCSILFVYLIAEKRAENKKFWVIMGLFFGPLAIPFVFFSKTKVNRNESNNERSCKYVVTRKKSWPWWPRL